MVLPGLSRLLRRAGTALLGLDRRCQGCGLLAAPDCGEPVLCAACAGELAPRLGGFCPACGELHEAEHGPPHLCGACLHTPPPWQAFHFFGPYQGRLKALLLAYKFNAALQHQALLMDLACRAHALHADGPAPDVLVPVPLHPRRLVWRGFNQSLELARGLAASLRRPLEPGVLTRVRPTVPQARLPRAERLGNLRGAFAVAPEVAGRRVLLVDDVMTTGATLRECAAALGRAGAEVEVLVIARA